MNKQIKIDKRDFDANRPLLDHASVDNESGASDEPQISRLSADSDGSDRPGEGLLSEVVENIVERDRAKMKREVIRITSFVWSVLSWYVSFHLLFLRPTRTDSCWWCCSLGAGSITAFSLYGPLLLTRLQYSQDRVNGIAVAAEVAMYLPVSIFGYLCDRYSPSPVSLLAGIFFGAGYLLAALSYKSGPPVDVGGSGWPYWVMVVAFVLIGMGTCCLYGAAVTTCAKNFGRGKYKGIMLAVPIAAFGLSGMWQSQIGSHVLCERLADGSCSEAVDVFRYFIFLAILLFAIGVGGTAALRTVDGEEQEKYIDEAVSELERSGILGEDGFFRPREEVRAAYGTFQNEGSDSEDLGDDRSLTLSEEERAELRRQKERQEEERQKKNWLLNHETRLFFKDHTMWWLALGFFFVTGPGEAYINNVSASSMFNFTIANLSIAGYNHPLLDPNLISSSISTTSRLSLNPRQHNRHHINNRPSPSRLHHRPLRTTRNTPIYLQPRQPKPPTDPPSDRQRLQRHYSLAAYLPPPERLGLIYRLLNPCVAPNTPSSRPIPSDNRLRRLRLRCLLRTHAHHYLRGLGRREFRHELGYSSHGPGRGCRILGLCVLKSISRCSRTYR